MKLEEEERKFLLLFLLDYKDLPLYDHLFHNKVKYFNIKKKLNLLI